MPPRRATPSVAAMALSRGRRITIRACLILGTILAVLSIFALWANRQVLNPDNWSDTSSALLQDEEIQTQISEFLVDQAYTNVDVPAEIANALPPQFAALAGPAAGALRSASERTAKTALDRPRVQAAWQEANRLTAQQFVNIAEGDSKAVTAQGNAVVLDLRVVLVDLVERLGLPSTVSDKIPAGAGKIKIMSSEQVGLLQSSVNAVRGLSVVLPVLAFGLLGLAVFLAAGRRRHTMMWAGIDLVIAGSVVLIGRRIGGGAVMDSLVQNDAARPAADNAWAIGTGMLQDIGQACVVLGIPLIFAAWLAGSTRWAVAARRWMAPTLNDSPGTAYGVALLVLLLFIAWGPIHATRLVIPVLIFFALTILGVAMLRRQVQEEFPADLDHLNALHSSGSITDEQFEPRKAALLADGGATN